jgi:hypothetical protein
MAVRNNWKTWCAAGALAGLTVCSVTIAREGQVKVRGGKLYAGDITETPETVRVTARGVETTLDRTDVTGIAYAAGLDEQYEKQLDKLNPRDIQGRVELARWAFDHHRYDLAEDAVDLALAIDADDREAITFQKLVQTQKRMEAARKNVAAPTAAPAPTGAPTGPTTQATSGPAADGEASTPAGTSPPAARNKHATVPDSFLSPEEINRIRQAELKETDRGVKIRFDNDVLRRYAIVANIPLTRFTAYDRIDQALKIINDSDSAFRDDVRMMSDPPSLTEFRTRVLPTLVNGCASNVCHGSPGAGEFFLYNKVNSEAVAYTDFYLLQSYVKTIDAAGGGVFGGATQRKMIDRNQPNASLLLQYSLPTDLADIDHPHVQGWKPLLKSQEDLRYRDLLNWIRAGLTPVDPDYGIKYQPPLASNGSGHTTAAPRRRGPASEPADAQSRERPRYQPKERFQSESVITAPGAPDIAAKRGEWGLTVLNEAARLREQQKQQERADPPATPAGESP